MANKFFSNIISLFGGTKARAQAVEAKSSTVEAGFDRVAQEVMGFAIESGTGNNFILTFTPQPSAMPANGTFVFIATHGNTGAATMQIGSLPAVSMLDNKGAALTSGAIASGDVVALHYNGTAARMIGVTKSYVDAASFSAALPAQAGNAGKTIVTDGSVASWSDTMTRLVVAAGTVGAPSVVIGDPDTGLYAPSAGDLAIAINGVQALILSGANVTLDGAARRFMADFSNATLASRMSFQSSTVNGATGVGVLPNGTSTTSTLRAFNNSDPTNSSAGSLGVNSSLVSLSSEAFGSGTTLPLAFLVGGTEAMRIDASRNVGIGVAATAGYRLDVRQDQDSFTVVRVRNATVGSSAQSIFQATSGTTNAFVNFGSYDANGLPYGGISCGAGILNFYLDAPTHILRSAAGVERARLDNQGRFIVGGTAHVALQASTYLGEFLSSGSNFPLAAGYTAASALGPKFTLAKNRSATWASNTVVQSGDTLGEIDFMGADGTNIIPGVRLGAYVDAVPGTNDMPARFSIATTADGAPSPTERFRIDSSGNVGIGVFANLSTLTVNGSFAARSPSTINAAAYSVLSTDFSLRFTTTSCTVTLPAAASFPGRILTLNNITANSVVSASSNVVPLGSNTPGTAILAATAGRFAQLQSDGTNWITMMAN